MEKKSRLDRFVNRFWIREYTTIDLFLVVMLFSIKPAWISGLVWLAFLFITELLDLRLNRKQTIPIPVDTSDLTGGRIYVKYKDGNELTGLLRKRKDGKYDIVIGGKPQ